MSWWKLYWAKDQISGKFFEFTSFVLNESSQQSYDIGDHILDCLDEFLPFVGLEFWSSFIEIDIGVVNKYLIGIHN